MKKLKKILPVTLSSCLLLASAGCAGSSSPADTKRNISQPSEISLDGSWPQETVKIGFAAYDTTAEQYLVCMNYFNYLSEYFNIEIISSESLHNADEELAFISECAKSGCEAIIGYYNEGKAESAKAAMDLGMYYWGGFGGDMASYEEVKEYDLYLGGYTLGDAEYEAGRSMAEALIDQGCEKIVLCSGGADFGIEIFVDRTQGFKDVISEVQAAGRDIEIVYEIKGWPDVEGFADEQASALDMDIDAIASTFDPAIWFQPLMDSSKADSVKIAAVGQVNDTYHDFFSNGVISCIVYDCEEVLFGSAIPIILNAVSGYAVRNDNGTAPLYPVQRWTITTPEEYDTIYDLHDNGEYIISAQDVANLIKAYNPGTTAYDLFNFYSKFTMDSIKTP